MRYVLPKQQPSLLGDKQISEYQLDTSSLQTVIGNIKDLFDEREGKIAAN